MTTTKRVPLAISGQLVHAETQTTTSLESSGLFNFENDWARLNDETPVDFQFKAENVERLVSAVQGDDESIRQKGRVLNPYIRRFHQLIRSLQNQIQQRTVAGTRKEHAELAERLVKQLARAIDPASRHAKDVNMFSHQKYESPIKVGRATLIQEDREPTEFTAIYNYNGTLFLTNERMVLRFDNVRPQSLVAGEDILITNKKITFGMMRFADGDEESEEQPNLSVMEPVTEDDRDFFLIQCLGSKNGKINLKTLVNPYDFSFVDIVLSIPKLSAEEAKGLMSFLYQSNYLSAYVRSKLCQFIYERNKSRDWPELLGRFIGLLQHHWMIDSAMKIERLELPQVVKSLATLGPHATFLLNIIFTEFEGLERGDLVEFVWEFLCKSVFTNLCLGNDENSVKRRKRLDALYQGTKEKAADCKTRIITQRTIEKIRNNQDYQPPPKTFSLSDFLHNIILDHPDEILIILKNIPRTKDEASPLFYPIALEVRDALAHCDEVEVSQMYNEDSGIISNISFRQSESDLNYSNTHSTNTSPSRSKANSKANSKTNSKTGSSGRRSPRSSKPVSTASFTSRSTYASKSKSSQGGDRKSPRQQNAVKRDIELLSENSDTASYFDELSASSSTKSSQQSSKLSSHSSRSANSKSTRSKSENSRSINSRSENSRSLNSRSENSRSINSKSASSKSSSKNNIKSPKHSTASVSSKSRSSHNSRNSRSSTRTKSTYYPEEEDYDSLDNY